jgi:hypothetical protein
MRPDRGPAVSIAAVACAVLALAGAARAQEEQEEFRCPKPGTVIEFTSGSKLTFTDQDGMWCVATDVHGRPWRWYAMLAGVGSRYVENHVEQIWPLRIGKEVSFTVKSTPKNIGGGILAETRFWYVEKFAVVRRERVTVRAGTFDTWVIEQHEDSSRPTFSATAITWYAPEVGYAVKYSYHIARGIGKDNAYEARRSRPPLRWPRRRRPPHLRRPRQRRRARQRRPSTRSACAN